MRIPLHIMLTLLGTAALAACGPTLPDARREAQLRGTSQGAIAPPGAPSVASIDALSPDRPRGDAPTTIARQRSEWAADGRARTEGGDIGIGIDSAAISDEQNFDAVAERETIESDRARLEQLRAQRVVVAPTALPTRTGEVGPNIVAYALNTRNRPGEQVYTRLNPFRESASARNCAAYAGPDQAQIDFLRRGGPDSDPRSLDPDGDGFACDWDPTPFRAALGR